MCAFPYVIAFTPNSMEIRLIVNGNLVHTMTMPQLQLVASKNDIFFATTAPEFFPNRTDRLLVDSKQHEQQKHTPPSSPSGNHTQKSPSSLLLNLNFLGGPEGKPLRIYRIPIHTLSKSASSDQNTGAERKTSWKSTEAKLTVPDHHPRISRSATSSPIPPPKGKTSSAIK